MFCLKASSKGDKVFLPPKCTIEATLPKRHILTSARAQTVGRQQHLTGKVLLGLRKEPQDMY